MRSFLYKQFPPPHYLRMPAFGLDISDRALKFITFKTVQGKKQIDAYGKIDIPEGIIESGEIKNSKDLSRFIRKYCATLGIKYVYVTLPEERGYMSVITLPNLQEEEIPVALESAFSQYVPIPIYESVFDYEILSSKKNRADSIQAMLTAFPANIVRGYYQAVTEAGFIPLAFDTEVQALSRAVIPQGDARAFLIVDFGRTRTTFIIVYEGEVRFTSTIEISGFLLDQAIAKTFGVSLKKAEQMKKDEVSLITSHKNNKLFETLLPIVSAIRDEAERYVDFWETHSGENHKGFVAHPPIHKMFLCGGDANLIGFPEYLSHNLNIDAEYANVWTNVCSFEEYIPELTMRESLTYGSAIGLALRAADLEEGRVYARDALYPYETSTG